MTAEPSPLQWNLFIRKRPSATQGTPPGREELKWVANTATLIYGRREALLVDTFLSEAHSAELADWIVNCGKHLSTIYITHAHPDHFFGLKVLRDRFPKARAIACPQVVQAMQAALAPASIEVWQRRFPQLIPAELVPAERLEDEAIHLEGFEINPIDIGHTDTDHTTCLHVPSIGLVVAGDSIYNDTHPYMVEATTEGLYEWLAAIEKIEALNPTAVVVGHGPLDPDNSPRHMTETKRYIRDFIRISRETSSARELYDEMLALYPNRINPGSLWGSAKAAKPIPPGRAADAGAT